MRHINYFINYQEADTLDTGKVSFKSTNSAEARILAAEVLVFYASKLKLSLIRVHLYGEVNLRGCAPYWSEVLLDPTTPEAQELEEKAIADLDSDPDFHKLKGNIQGEAYSD